MSSVYLESHLEPTRDRVQPTTLYEGNRGHYEMAALMVGKTVTSWAQAFVHHGEHFKVE